MKQMKLDFSSSASTSSSESIEEIKANSWQLPSPPMDGNIYSLCFCDGDFFWLEVK